MQIFVLKHRPLTLLCIFTKMFDKKLFNLQLLPEVNKFQEIKIKMNAEQP